MNKKSIFFYSIFFLSGASGLIYEILWMRYFSLLFGNTAKAAAVVLTVFFLGMAIGNVWGGFLTRRVRNPLRTYGWVEVGIALSALPVLFLLPLYEMVFLVIFQTLEQSPFLFDLVRFFMALVLTLPAGVLLGMTLPLMGTVVVQDNKDIGRFSGFLYGFNTLGAVVGVMVTGFFLPPLLGITLTYFLAVGINILLGIVAIQIAGPKDRFYSLRDVKQPYVFDSIKKTTGASENTLPIWVLLGLAFASGAGVIALEVLWTRMLALVLHNSVYSFSAILLVVLVGLSLGAFFIAHFQNRIHNPVKVLGITLGLTAFFSLLTPFIFYKATGLAFFAYGSGWPWYVFKILYLIGGVIFIPVLFAGMTLPLLWRMYGERQSSVGMILGQVTFWNLMGAIAGALLGGFLLIPMIGLWKSICLVSILFLFLSQFSLSYLTSTPIRQWGFAAVTGFVLVALFVSNPFFFPIQRLKEGEKLLFIKEGEDALVSVVEEEGGIRRLKSNNTYNLGGTFSVRGEKRLGHLPMLLHPAPKKAAFVGIATGISMSALLDHPVEEIVGIEILPGVLEALPYFEEFNRKLQSHKKVKMVIGDGRVYLKTTDKKFDVVISDLFVPWHAGTGNLYTLEHFETVRDRLAPGGLFCQWIPLYQVSEAEFGSIAATFAEAFPYVSIWRGDFSMTHPILGLVGSMAPIHLNEQILQRRLSVLSKQISPDDPLLQSFSDFSLLYAGDLNAVQPWVNQFPLNILDLPYIEFQAPISQTRRKLFNREALASFYSSFDQNKSNISSVQMVPVAEVDQIPLSPKAGNLLAQAVEAGAEKNIKVQLNLIKDAIGLLPGSDYLKVLNVVLGAMGSGGTRDVLVDQTAVPREVSLGGRRK